MCRTVSAWTRGKAEVVRLAWSLGESVVKCRKFVKEDEEGGHGHGLEEGKA